MHLFHPSCIFCNALLHVHRLPQSVLDIKLARSSEHITPVLRQLHWLPIKQRITYKAMNGMAPKYIVDLLQRYTPTRQLRSSSNNLLVIPKLSLKSYGDRSFQVAAPRLWNTLPNSIKSIQSLNGLKNKIKTLLFKEAVYY